MKKMITTLAIAFSSLFAFAGETNVNQKVLDAFKNEFTTATEVEWSAGFDYYKATFNYNGKYVYAYFNEDGEMLGMARNMSPIDLPLALQNNLKKSYEGFWVSDLFEAVKNENTNYYITLENADTKLVLKSSGNSWNVYSKTRKS
jgi:hypothetical protein